MPDSCYQDYALRVIDVIHDPIVSNPDSIDSIVQFLGIRPARVFADFVEFLNDPFSKHSRQAGQLLVSAGRDPYFVE